MREVIKARYENKVLKPLGEIDLKDGEEVEIELKKKGHLWPFKRMEN